MESTWENRDLPVLEAIVMLLDESGAFMVSVGDVAGQTGLKVADVDKAIEAMEGIYIVKYNKTLTGGDPTSWYVTRVTPAARRAVGQWPTADSLITRIVDGFNDAAEREPDPERKSRLKEIASGLGGSVRDVAVDIAARIIEHKTGLG